MISAFSPLNGISQRPLKRVPQQGRALERIAFGKDPEKPLEGKYFSYKIPLAFRFAHTAHEFEVLFNNIAYLAHCEAVASYVGRFTPVQKLGVKTGNPAPLDLVVGTLNTKEYPLAISQKQWLEKAPNKPTKRDYYDPKAPQKLQITWEDMIVAAMVHDVVKHKPGMQEALLRKFGPAVQTLVNYATLPPKDEKNQWETFKVPQLALLITGGNYKQLMDMAYQGLKDSSTAYWDQFQVSSKETLNHWNAVVQKFVADSEYPLLADNLEQTLARVERQDDAGQSLWDTLKFKRRKSQFPTVLVPDAHGKSGERTALAHYLQGFRFAYQAHQHQVHGKSSSIPYSAHWMAVLSYVQRYAPLERFGVPTGTTAPLNLLVETIDTTKHHLVMPKATWEKVTDGRLKNRTFYDPKDPTKMLVTWADVQVAAMLHDTLEDRPDLEQQLLQTFGPVVYSLVKYCTTDKLADDKAHQYNDHKSDYLKRARNGPLSVRLILGCDKKQNMDVSIQELKANPQGFWKAFKRGKEQKLDYWKSIVEILGTDKNFPLLWDNLRETYERLMAEVDPPNSFWDRWKLKKAAAS